MMDAPLLGVAVLFFGLSFVLAWVVDKLPVWCQSSWFLIAVWGIFCVNFAYGVIHPEAWPHIYKIAVIFFAALPGIMWLDHLQKKNKIHYWKRQGVPPECRAKVLYLAELLDRLAWWWTKRRINDELQNDNLPEYSNSGRSSHLDNRSGDSR